MRHVQPIWDATYPGDPAVEQYLQLAEDLLAGRVVLPDSDPRINLESFSDWELDKYGDGVNDPDKAPAHYVLDAAWRACYMAHWAVGDPKIIFDDIPEGHLDDDDDAWDRPTDYACACAVGGPFWEKPERIDLAAHREFWTWWLDVAVPQAAAG